MRPVVRAFTQFLRSIWEDFMVVACLIGPIFMGAVIHIGVPLLERYLCDTFHRQVILTPYYPVFDLLLMIMTPLMVGFAGVMTMLEEIDASTAKYLCVTPVGKGGYLMSRVGIPVLLSIVYSSILIILCGVSDIGVLAILISIVTSSVVCILVSLFVVGFAKNKVEGMAMMKLSGLLVAAALVPFFIQNKASYVLGVLPSFWMGQFVVDGKGRCIPLFLVTSLIWGVFIYRRFKRKLS